MRAYQPNMCKWSCIAYLHCFHSHILLHMHAAKVKVLCAFKALDMEQNDKVSLKEFYKLYDVLSLRWERVSSWSKLPLVQRTILC